MIKEYGYELTFKRLIADRSGQREKRISVLSAIIEFDKNIDNKIHQSNNAVVNSGNLN